MPWARKSTACDGTISRLGLPGNGEMDLDICPGQQGLLTVFETTSSVTIVRVLVLTAPAVVRKSALIGLSGALGKVSVALIDGESTLPKLCGTAT